MIAAQSRIRRSAGWLAGSGPVVGLGAILLDKALVCTDEGADGGCAQSAGAISRRKANVPTGICRRKEVD
jgi:hypothetical protein